MPNLKTHIAALEWQLEAGVDVIVEDEPVDSTAMPELPKRETNTAQASGADKTTAAPQQSLTQNVAREKAIELAKNAKTLEELRDMIAMFDGIGLKKTATNLVFGDGNPAAKIMLVGEAPGADEDRQGKPLVGHSGQLLDRMMKWIDLDRTSEDPEAALYITNILNFRPPGNRTPTPQEIELSLPFIEKHIALVKPDMLILAGSIAGKALLNSTDNMSKMRGKMHSYTPLTTALFNDNMPAAIPTMAIHHPTSLLRTPAQKKQVWQDLLLFKETRKSL